MIFLFKEIWPNGIIFHLHLDFPEIRGPISLPKRYLLGAQVVWGRYNLTRRDDFQVQHVNFLGCVSILWSKLYLRSLISMFFFDVWCISCISSISARSWRNTFLIHQVALLERSVDLHSGRTDFPKWQGADDPWGIKMIMENISDRIHGTGILTYIYLLIFH